MSPHDGKTDHTDLHSPYQFDDAITIYSCSASLMPDAAFRGHIDAVAQATRAQELKERERERAIVEEEQRARIFSIQGEPRSTIMYEWSMPSAAANSIPAN